MNNITKSLPMTAGRGGLPVDLAPRDGQTLRLLVRYSADEEPGRWTPLEDEFESWTIGHNSLDNTGEDVWVFVGWDWSQDYYLQALSGTVIGWLPFHAAAEPDLLMPLLKLANAVEPLVATPPIVGPITQGVRDALTEARQALAALQAGEKVSAPSQGGWLPIETAPKDGTLILTWCVHVNAQYCEDAVAEGYAGPVIAKWIDHNGGGFTWHGLAGEHTHWMPLPDAPNTTGKAPEAAREGGA